MKKIKILILFITLFTACKQEVKKEIIESKQEETTKNFVVNVNFKINKQDVFKLMMNNVLVDEFQTKNIHVIERVVPTSSIDELTADFGENISNNFIVNFGNKEVKEIQIESINISYGEQSLNISSKEIKKYFAFNKFIKQEDNGKLLTVKIDGKHNPLMTLRRNTINLLKKAKN